ncbi:peptidase m16 inactive domain-containing protein [Phthorimaea operculella]|nr:peptidase m16 inactive domain-containing protein [Phthorimaea operculella]
MSCDNETCPVASSCHFKLVSTTKANDVIPVNKYVSEKTGVTVIIADVEGPLVNGFFCLATEAHDDDGLPHTLEHLIFLGSERYPYKGILDLLANRCMSQGTNAWTDTDHTCYTIYTAGDEGMLTLLPIYLDHILRPTLTDEGYITEVHHIDGEGEDAGVVYCEMQGRENSADSRCELRLLRAMYPNSGYSSETGGIMENLRTSTNNVKVRNFHKKFYRPENLTIILTGQIEAQDVFKALETVENDIIAKREKEPQEKWEKPWTSVPPKPTYGELKEQWPAEVEDCGQVLFGWRGPILKETRALKDLTACAVLLRYLCDTASAPLQRALVERDDALAGDVSYNLTENIAPLIKIELDNVPVNKLEAARDQAQAVLKAVRSGEEPIDMERMKRLLKKQLRESIAHLESDPHHAIAFRCIGDALYSQNESDFMSRMNPQRDLEELLNESADYWLGLMKKYFTDELVTIVGSPSIALQTKMAEDEKKRIEAQRAKLGEKGLAEKAKQLEAAMEFNERPPPPGTLGSVPVPSCKRLKTHQIFTWSSDGAPCPYINLKDIPLYARVHSLKTNFVYINLILDTTSVDQLTRKWLPLHMNGLAECPVKRGDAIIPHEDVISTTEQLTVKFSNDIGFGRSGTFSVGVFGNFVHIETRCEPQDYEEVVNHLYEVLYAPEITKERLQVFTQRMIHEVAQVRRDGHKMVYDTLRDSLYCEDSNMHWSGVLRQSKFLKQLNELLNAGQSLLKQFNELLNAGQSRTHVLYDRCHKMVYDTLRDSLYCEDSNMHWSGVLRQSKFLKQLNELLNAGQSLLKQFNELLNAGQSRTHVLYDRCHKMVYDTLRDSLYCEDSNMHWSGVLRQSKEKHLVLHNLKGNKNILENKNTDNATENLKKQCWSESCQYRLATGGGGPCPDADINPDDAETAPALLVEIPGH